MVKSKMTQQEEEKEEEEGENGEPITYGSAVGKNGVGVGEVLLLLTLHRTFRLLQVSGPVPICKPPKILPGASQMQ